MQEPGFWDDQKRRRRRVGGAQPRDQEARVVPLARGGDRRPRGAQELAREDDSLADELGEQLTDIERRLDELEEERLFQGRYDAGRRGRVRPQRRGRHRLPGLGRDAPRMYLRWAERRGFDVELSEARRARRRASSRPRSWPAARTPTGSSRPRRASTGLCGSRPSTPPTGATRASPVEVSPLVEDDVDVEIDEEDLRSRPTARQGAGGQHVNKTDSAVRITHIPTKIVVQCQNERSQSSNKQTAMKLLRSKLVELEEQRRREEIARREGRGPGRRLGLADPLVRAPSVHDGQGPPHRLRDGRRQPGARRRPRRLRARVPRQECGNGSA